MRLPVSGSLYRDEWYSLEDGLELNDSVDFTLSGVRSDFRSVAISLNSTDQQRYEGPVVVQQLDVQETGVCPANPK